MEKTLFVEGNQGDANFRVGLQKYVIPAPLYCVQMQSVYTSHSFASRSFHCDLCSPPPSPSPPVCGERDGVLQGQGPSIVTTTTSVYPIIVTSTTSF